MDRSCYNMSVDTHDFPCVRTYVDVVRIAVLLRIVPRILHVKGDLEICVLDMLDYSSWHEA